VNIRLRLVRFEEGHGNAHLVRMDRMLGDLGNTRNVGGRRTPSETVDFGRVAMVPHGTKTGEMRI
jgi:hypothetical protein